MRTPATIAVTRSRSPRPISCRSGTTAAALLNEIIRGWQINGTFAAYSGAPFTVTASNSALDQRGNLQTADQVGEVRRVGIGPDEPCYDPTAWANITERRYGNFGLRLEF